MADQLSEAGLLLAVGMVVVFAFLTLLIGGIKSIEAFVRAFPSKEEQANNNKNKTQAKAATEINPDIVAAISTAVHVHRHTTR
ncbi:OadG family protein [Glaciecola sp. 1036]|uniref:OadG family protein n=1 Tax=Alteromonadaceae TaxID=72275 RepID=UPI003D039ADF